jgi:hypothetical protein
MYTKLIAIAAILLAALAFVSADFCANSREI